MKVLMLPSLQQAKSGRDGVSQVIKAYHKYLPDYDIELVAPETTDYDLVAGHIYQGIDLDGPFVVHSHGLHWTADYPGYYGKAQYKMNMHLVNAIRKADEITVPSSWVAETFQRDMRFTPNVIPHGIDWQDWQHSEPQGDYVLWNKNRAIGVCDPTPLVELSRRFRKLHFATTFLPPNSPQLDNTNVLGIIPHDQMKRLVQSSLVYLATTKETFGIGILEAMASGVPVLGYAYGGILDLVEHGVNGYLAKPNNIEDLAEGLNYCLENRRVLGVNGQEMARGWTWQSAVEKVAGVYRLAVEGEKPTVSVVIPVYNKSEEELERAIRSTLDQSFRPIDIIIIDDGSSSAESYERIVSGFKGTHKDCRIEYRRFENSGVAIARNRGFELSRGKYCCALDSDDWLEPTFLEVCIDTLEKDNTLGIAYTSLQYHKPDGSTGTSQWPDDWDYDAQLKRQNQVPTCCVFRREMWERLGGYRQRYAPTGAGAEDAEFWLRSGAFGWKAEKVTDEPLFNYSWMTGQVTGDPGYKEIDWLTWAPYAKDGQHPFASYATPSHFSHPIRQYDEPVISVIIPVGPGHEMDVIDALDSLEAQTFRKWECIVVWDGNSILSKVDEVQGINVVEYSWTELQETIHKAYPYVKFRSTGSDLPNGAGWARNFGATFARAPFLFFLDADDWLYDNETLQKMLDAWNDTKAIPYSDYMGRSYIEDPKEVNKLSDAGRLVAYNEKTHEALTRFQAFDFDCERVLQQPELPNPYTFCLISTLVPKIWHDGIGGFDEAMPSWEDVDYHWRMVRSGRCYVRIEEPLILYRFYTGTRREGGRQEFKNLVKYISEKYEKDGEIVGCQGCPGKRKSPVSNVWASTNQQAKQLNEAGLRDEDFVLIRYMHPNKGDHQVIGSNAINPITTRKFNYGQHQYGDKFLVHRDDVYMPGKRGSELVLRDPARFVPIQDTRVEAPKEEKPELKSPEPLIDLETLEDYDGEQFEAEVDAIMQSVLEEDERPLDLQTLPGVTSGIEDQLDELGIKTKDDLLEFGVDGLVTVKGIGDKRAELIIKALEG